MAVTLHPLARTTPRTRAELRAEDPSLSDAELARRYGVTAPTVRKWRTRDSTADRSHRPDVLLCTLTPAQEAVAMAIRETLWLPLDDLLVVVREFLNAKVSRSGLARCMKRHGVNRRPVEDKDAPIVRKTFKDYAPGFLHVDIKYLPQMADETTRRYLFVAIDRATRWVHVRIYADQSEASSTDFLRRLQAAAPMKIEKILTDNGSQFTDRFTAKGKQPSGNHAFDRQCAAHGIEHRLITPRRPQTNGMVERFNGRISDILATTRFRSREDLQVTLKRYVTLYNDHLPQRALGRKTPLQTLRMWHKERPDLFRRRIKNRRDRTGNRCRRFRWSSIYRISRPSLMKKIIVKWIFIIVIFGILLCASIYFYGTRSESFRFVELAIKNSQEIELRVGHVQKVSLDPAGEFREKFFNMKKRAIMTVDVNGDKGNIVANVSVVKTNGAWDLNEIIVDGKSIYKKLY